MRIKIACWNSIQSSLKLLALGLAAVIICCQNPALGTDIATQKLYGHWTNPSPIEFGLGAGSTGSSPCILASNENWIVVGAPVSSDQTGVALGGAVQVFNAVTGAWARKLLPPTIPQPNTYYGTACAVSGSTAVIGATGPIGTSPGAAYVYNLATGALLKTLRPVAPSAGTNGDSFGFAVAISGNRVIVGAYAADSNRGRAYIFDLNTGAQLAMVQSPGGLANDLFGFAIAAEGNVVIIGAPYVDASRGAVYAYDLTTLGFIQKYYPAASVAGDGAGWSVAMHQGKMILGAPFANAGVGKVFVMGILDGAETTLTGSDVGANEHLGICVATHQGLLIAGSPTQAGNRGAAYLFDLNSTATTEFQKLLPPDGGTSYFGLNVSICGNQAVMTAPLDHTQATSAGALYVMSPVMRPMPLTKVAAKGDFAPGAFESNFLTIGDAFLNSDGEVAFASTTTGLGVNGGTGVWNTLAANQPLDLVLKSHQLDGGLTVVSVSTPLVNFNSTSIFSGTLSGTGVTTLNNQAIYKDDGTTVTRILRTGDAAAAFGGAVPSSFTQVVQSQGFNRVAATCVLRQGVVSTTAANDSGLLWYDIGTSTSEAQREGSTVPGSTLVYGQFTGRVANYWNSAVYATALAAPTTAAFNQAVFQKLFGAGVAKVAQKGDLATSAGGAPYSSFIGESSDDGDRAMYRATLGAPATTANNEGLWVRTAGGGYTLAMRKGDLVPGLTGVHIAKFISYWQSNSNTLALVQLTGTGVTAANDQALLAYESSGALAGQVVVLMREGDPAPGGGAATIGTISRVALEPYWTHYLVLATLVGAPAGTELALYRGFASKPLTGTAQATLIRPVQVLRKGQLFFNQPGKITSISLPASNLTASGAGNTGLGLNVRILYGPSSITPTTTVIAVDFANGVHQVMKGIP